MDRVAIVGIGQTKIEAAKEPQNYPEMVYEAVRLTLEDCYLAAIPFLRDFTVSTVVYSAVLFSAYELIASAVRGKPAACGLLKKI